MPMSSQHGFQENSLSFTPVARIVEGGREVGVGEGGKVWIGSLSSPDPTFPATALARCSGWAASS